MSEVHIATDLIRFPRTEDGGAVDERKRVRKREKACKEMFCSDGGSQSPDYGLFAISVRSTRCYLIGSGATQMLRKLADLPDRGRALADPGRPCQSSVAWTIGRGVIFSRGAMLFMAESKFIREAHHRSIFAAASNDIVFHVTLFHQLKSLTLTDPSSFTEQAYLNPTNNYPVSQGRCVH